MKPQTIDKEAFKKAIGTLRVANDLNIREFCEKNNAMRGTAKVKPEWISIISGIYPEFANYMNIDPSDIATVVTVANGRNELIDCQKEVILLAAKKENFALFFRWSHLAVAFQLKFIKHCKSMF